MTHDETQKRLDAIAAAMVDAGIKLPDATLMLRSGGNHSMLLKAKYGTGPFDGKSFNVISGDGIDDLLTKAADYIASLPDPDTAAKQNWQKKLGGVIDEGHALNLPDEVMSPLRQGSQAMTENLLAAPEVTS